MLQDLANDVQVRAPDHVSDPHSFVKYVNNATTDLRNFLNSKQKNDSNFLYGEHTIGNFNSDHDEEGDIMSDDDLRGSSQQKRKRIEAIDTSLYSRTPPTDVPIQPQVERKEISQFHPVTESPLDYIKPDPMSFSTLEIRNPLKDNLNKKQKFGSIPDQTNVILDNVDSSISDYDDENHTSRRTPRRSTQRKRYDYSTNFDDEEYSQTSSKSSTNKKSSDKKKNKSQRNRLPQNTLEEWGFDVEDIKREFELEMKRCKDKSSDKRGYKWSRIAKKIGNEKFLASGDCGTKLKALLRREYPDLVGLKIKIPDDPKKEWGFTAKEVVEKIEDLTRAGKKVSLSKVGYLLGHKTSSDGKRKAFSERCDRGQLVHALLQSEYPEIAKRFERGSKKEDKKYMNDISKNTMNNETKFEVSQPETVEESQELQIEEKVESSFTQDMKPINDSSKSETLLFPGDNEQMEGTTPVFSPPVKELMAETPPYSSISPNLFSSLLLNESGISSLSPGISDTPPLLGLVESSYPILLHMNTPGTSPVVEISSV